MFFGHFGDSYSPLIKIIDGFCLTIFGLSIGTILFDDILSWFC